MFCVIAETLTKTSRKHKDGRKKRVWAGEGTYRREKDKRRAWHGRKKERVQRPMQNRGS